MTDCHRPRWSAHRRPSRAVLPVDDPGATLRPDASTPDVDSTRSVPPAVAPDLHQRRRRSGPSSRCCRCDHDGHHRRRPLAEPPARQAAAPRQARSRPTGWWPPTVASSPSAAPRSTARPGGIHLNQPIVGMAATAPTSQRVLAGGLRRRGLRLRQRRLPRLHRRPPPQPAHRGHGRHPGRRRLLAGGLRRRDLRLRRRPLLRVHGRHRPQPAHRGHGRRPGRPRLLAGGRGRRASSPSATPTSTARPATSI